MKYGLIGKTLVHSYSKEIHETLGKYTYELFSLEPAKVSDFVKDFDFGGLNVTIPYKKDVIPLCDEISELAAAIGSVNTLYRKGHTLVGHNTDYEGFLYTASRSNIDFAGRTVLILGTGGTSLTAQKAVSDKGAKKIYVASRSAAGGNEEAGGTSAAGKSSAGTTFITYAALPEFASQIEIIINTTPVGTYPNNLKSVISLSDFKSCEAVIDVIYNPFKTKLLMDAEKAGLKTAGGLPMLVAQATAAAGYFLDMAGGFEKENEKIILQMKRDIRNIVLIGMPGCGKTTIGRLIAKITGKTFIDMDEEIEKKEGRSIPQIFAASGEEAFRDVEALIAAEYGKMHGLVIATGGGAVLRSENVEALKQNGCIIHIKRPVDSLPMQGRPLSKDIDALRKMESERMPIYESVCDVSFDNSLQTSERTLEERLCAELSL